MKITRVFARQILDSRGDPTVEAEVTLENGVIGRSAVPSGASAGKHEALELRDDGQPYLGKGVNRAINHINTEIRQAVVGQDLDQVGLDQLLIKLDGTANKSRLGANAILAVSLAFAWAASRAENLSLYQYIGQLFGNSNFILPRPMFNIMNGGKHGDWATDIQEFMIIPAENLSWGDRLRLGSEVFHHLQTVLKEKGYSINVGNEGGFAPAVKSNQEAIELIAQAIQSAGFKLGGNVTIGFDAAASEFYNEATQQYELKRDGVNLSSEEMIDWIAKLTEQYPVESLEDMLAEDDWAGWQALTARLGSNYQIVGDDLLVTNTAHIQQAIEQKTCNSLLVKLNQIGTLSETLQAMKMAQDAGWSNVVSHRSGETEDVTIAHLAVGTGCGWIKTGSVSRGERTAKYNELTRIAERLEASN
ncbi:MAG: phosphopyruvate hydratase [Candidatus Paceibacterota bacterium]